MILIKFIMHFLNVKFMDFSLFFIYMYGLTLNWPIRNCLYLDTENTFFTLKHDLHKVSYAFLGKKIDLTLYINRSRNVYDSVNYVDKFDWLLIIDWLIWCLRRIIEEKVFSVVCPLCYNRCCFSNLLFSFSRKIRNGFL